MLALNQPLARTLDHPTECLAEVSDLGLSYDLYEGLTEREELIAQWVASGKADWEIARGLGSDDPATIRKEILAVMDQLNVESVSELSRVMSQISL